MLPLRLFRLVLLPVSLPLALWDAPLIASLKAGCCEGLLYDLDFVISQVFFAGERFRDGELPEDKSLSARVSTSSRTSRPLPFITGDQLHITVIILCVFATFLIWARN